MTKPHSGERYGWLLVLASCAGPAFSAPYVLQWDPAADERVSSYTVYYGERHRDYTHSVDVGTATTVTIPDLNRETAYYFAVKANSDNSNLSDFSNEATSGYFRYTFGMGAAANSSGALDVINMNQVPEQSVATGWTEYNALSGETRIATGDIDGDGRDEVVVGFAPVQVTGMAGGRFEVLDDDYSFLAWGQVGWPDYNAANGETRPAVGDIDGDGKAEIFIGLGRGGDGLIEMFRFANQAVSSFGWTAINWPEYGQLNGETWPTMGDLDGDRKNEIVIGLGTSGTGVFLLKKGFDETLLTAGVDPWLEEVQGSLSWAEYASQTGETRPAIGDLFGNGTQQIVVGLGQSGAGNLEVFKYLSPALTSVAALTVDWPEYNSLNGETRPAVGDIDGDLRGEIIVGLGRGGNGHTALFDDALSQFGDAGSLQVGTAASQVASGSVWPAFKREHATPTQPAVFHLLSVLKAGTGSGTVGGGGHHLTGTTVAPTAVAAAGSTLTNWSPATCGGAFELTVDATCTATFELNYTLTVKPSGSGTVTSIPAGISCGADCSEPYPNGTAVALTPAPAAGFLFSGWSGACTGTANCTVTMNAAKTVTTTFKVIPTYTLTVALAGTGSAGGTVTSAPAGVNCGTDCTETYVGGTVVRLTATPASGQVFSGWSGSCSGAWGCSFTMNATKNVTATFK